MSSATEPAWVIFGNLHYEQQKVTISSVIHEGWGHLVLFLSKREIILLQWKNRNCFSVVLLTFRTIQPVKLHWLNTCWSLKDLNHITADLPLEDISYFQLATLPIQSQISFENCWPAIVPGETEVDLWPNFKLSEFKFSRGPRQGDPFLPTIAWFFRNNETICGSGFSHRSGFPSCDRFSRREPHHVLVYRSKPVSSTKLLSFHFHLVECQVGQVDRARQMFVWCKVRSWANILIC